ncbi:MAG TPA: hypothetical protein VEJ18_14590, partial [Planctomycetota bacterium]|nr:hypothetical protein [Planctomycetota bacterium]
MMQVMVLATLAAWVQEDAESKRIGSLIERLGSDSVVERDEAAEALESIGPRALPSLRKALEGSPAELRARAEAAIRAIERNRKIDDLKAGGKPVTVRAKDVAAAELARTLGVQADASLGDRRMSLEVEGATLLESLDILCAATPNLTYGRDDAGALVLKAGRHPAHPAAYAGPFRLRILRLEARRVQTYLEHKILLRLRLGADHDPSVRPLPNPAIEILEAVDDRGAAVTLAKPSAREAAQAADGAGADGAVFTSTDLAPEATRLARLRAVVRPVFVLGSQDVVFPSPARGDVRELGSYRAT